MSLWSLLLCACAVGRGEQTPVVQAPRQVASASQASSAGKSPTTPSPTFRLEPAQKEPYCDWKGVDAQAVDAANQELLLSDAARARALATHLPFGVPPPRSRRQTLRVLKQFVIEYDSDLRAPTWTAYRLESKDVSEAERLEAFRADPFLAEEARAECRDYEEPIFDSGHLVPRADMNRSESAMLNTFLLSNMTPQHCATNRGPWLVLEDLVRQWAAEGPLLIYSGALYDWYPPEGEDPPEQVPRMRSMRYPVEMGEVRRVAVPSHLFKVVIRLRPAAVGAPIETIALLLPNSPRKVPKQKLEAYLESALVNPGRLERLTGVRFFPHLHRDAPALEATLLTRRAASLWPHERLAPQLTGRCKDGYPDY
ncbi:MAG: DNA/RNA non-specific endonuclease [Myxococcales bacterium]|nr:DNA/RNA non-specific endonuclease [Myxococcales bacterium]